MCLRYRTSEHQGHLEVHSHPSRAQGGLHPHGRAHQPPVRHSIESFAQDNKIPLITFAKGQRKDDFTKQQRKTLYQREGVVFIGKAQEKCTVYHTEKRCNPKVQLIFDRTIIKTTPGLFRTRIITDGVIPSLHIDYKRTRIKQYHKEGRALRTETTINNTYDFYIGKNLRNLPALRRIGFQANGRLLQVQHISHDCILAEEAFQKINRPLQVSTQRVSALRFVDPQVQALGRALLLFQLLPPAFPTAISANTSHLYWG